GRLRAGPADRPLRAARGVLLRTRQPRVGAAAAGAPALGAADPRLARAPRDLAPGESRGACHAHGQRAGGVADAELAVAAAAAAGDRGLRELDRHPRGVAQAAAPSRTLARPAARWWASSALSVAGSRAQTKPK